MGLGIGTGWTVTHDVVTDLDTYAATAINFGNRTVPTVDIPALNTPAGPVPTLTGDLYTTAPVVMPGYLDSDIEFVPGAPTLGILTITARQLPGQTTPATYVGNATLIDETKSVPVEDVCTEELSWKWATDYTHTPSGSA